MLPRFDSESSPLSQPSLIDMGWKARRSADSLKKLRAAERRQRAEEQGVDERLIDLREGLDEFAEAARKLKQARRDGEGRGRDWRAGQSQWADVDMSKEVDSWLVPMHAEPVTALASGAAACTAGAASSAAAAAAGAGAAAAIVPAASTLAAGADASTPAAHSSVVADLGLGVQLATAPAAPPPAKQAGGKSFRTDPCRNLEKCKRAAMKKQPVIRPPLPLSGHPGTELPGLGRPQFKGEQWFSQEGVHFSTTGGTASISGLTWKFAHQNNRHAESKAKGHKGPGTSGHSNRGVTTQQLTLMATGPLVQQMAAHVAGTSGSSSDAAPPAPPPAAPVVSAAPLPAAPLPTDDEEVLLDAAVARADDEWEEHTGGAMLMSYSVPLPKQRAAAGPVAPGASTAAAASSAADIAPIVSSVAEAADYAELTGRQMEAAELLLEHHKRARAAGTAQGLLPLNVLPARAGGESKCDKRDRNNLVRLLRSIRDYRKVVVADTEFGKRSSCTLPRDVASILKAMGVSIAEIIYAKKTADRTSNGAWDVHDWRTRTAQSAEEHTGGVACWCVCRALSKPHIEPATPCIPS